MKIFNFYIDKNIKLNNILQNNFFFLTKN